MLSNAFTDCCCLFRILREVSGRGEEKCSNMDGVPVRCLDGKSVEAGQNILSLLTNAQKTYDVSKCHV